MRSHCLRFCAALVLCAIGCSLHAAVPITVVNYASQPVHSTAVAVPLDALWNKLGLAKGSPVTVRSADGKQAFLVQPDTLNAQPVLWVYLSMPGASRLDLLADRAASWPPTPAAAQSEPGQLKGKIQNGVVEMSLRESGWQFGFSPVEKLSMISDGRLEFWVDTQNRGRIANTNPADLGLVQFPKNSQLTKVEASVKDGHPILEVVRQMQGIAKDLKVIETFELVPGLPILICRIRWENQGDAPLYIAYVGSGDGIKGKWAKPLMSGPLIERMKTPLTGIINGGETRPSWIGGLCKISMESPATGCGIGLSTLLPTPGKVGQGSMIWGCGAQGFQCNLIDPEQGQFPFLIKPHGSLLNGNAFLLTQNGLSVYRQVSKMWEALAHGKDREIAPPCAVFVDGQVLAHQTVAQVQDLVPFLLPSSGSHKAALRMDFNRYYECSGNVQLGSGASMEVIAHPVDKKTTPVTLAKLSQSGFFQFPIEKWVRNPDEVEFVLEFKPSGPAVLKSAAIRETIPVSPEMWSPLPEASITDIATMFRWKAIPLVTDFELQWARNPQFASPEIVRLTQSEKQPWYTPPADKLPGPGKWYWRIRATKGEILGKWSETRSFTVNAEHVTQPLIRPLSAEKPLFTLEASRWRDYREFVSDMPAEIRPYVAIIIEGFVDQELNIVDAMRGVEKIPHPFMIRSHPPTQISLADLEWVCQHFPNFLGIQGGETLSKIYEQSRGKPNGDADYHRRMTRLLAKYGRFYHEADGTYRDDKWQELWDQQGPFLKEFGRYMVFSAKNNIIRRQFYSQSSALGLWLGGISHHHGAWEDGGFYWQNAGFNGVNNCGGERRGVLKTMPRIFWSLVCLRGIATGCGIYSLDGQSLMESTAWLDRHPQDAWPTALWDDRYKTTDTFKRFMIPLIRATAEHKLVPNRQQVLANIKLAVFNDKTVKADAALWSHYMEYGPLYAATYGFAKMGNIHGQLWEYFPNTGRYYYIPNLPYGNVPLAPGVRNLPISALQDEAKVKATFDAAYPAFYSGDALVNRVGNTIVILNSNENMDITQSFDLPLQEGGFEALAGKVALHSYLLGKIEGGQLWMQANTEYPERDTELSVACAAEPAVEVVPAAALKSCKWDPAAKRLNLRLGHAEGAAEISIKAKP